MVVMDSTEMRPGDWSCSNCGAEKVYATRTHCNKCGAPKPGLNLPPQPVQGVAPQPQLAAPAGGKGEVRPGDWFCQACGAGPVFATRDACFKCGAPRPAGAGVNSAGGYAAISQPIQFQQNRASPYGATPGKGGGKGFIGKGAGIKELLRQISGGVQWKNDENTVVFQHLPMDTVDVDLYSMCARFGAIAGVHTKTDKGSGRCSGMALVNFMDIGGCSAAINALNGLQMPNGSTLIARQWSAEGPVRLQVEERPGDWTCSMCGAGPNFATRNNCFKCGAPKASVL